MPRIDLLKVDVEKSETEVLAGLAEEDWAKVRAGGGRGPRPGGPPARAATACSGSRGFKVTLEQDDLYRGSDRWNLYAVRAHIGSEPAAAGDVRPAVDRAASLRRAEERARKSREALRKGSRHE